MPFIFTINRIVTSLSVSNVRLCLKVHTHCYSKLRKLAKLHYVSKLKKITFLETCFPSLSAVYNDSLKQFTWKSNHKVIDTSKFLDISAGPGTKYLALGCCPRCWDCRWTDFTAVNNQDKNTPLRFICTRACKNKVYIH